jgi:hypothetical protein
VLVALCSFILFGRNEPHNQSIDRFPGKLFICSLFICYLMNYLEGYLSSSFSDALKVFTLKKFDCDDAILQKT